MEKRDVFISYARADAEAARTLCRYMEALGIHVFDTARDISAGGNFRQMITEAIRTTTAYVILVSEKTEESPSTLDELDFAFSTAKGRDKKIIPVSLIPPGQKMGDVLRYYLGRLQQISVPGPTEENLKEAAGEIARILGKADTKKLLYERLASYEKAALHDKAADTLCTLVWHLCQEIDESVTRNAQIDLYGELHRCAVQISHLYWPLLGSVKRDIHEALTDIRNLIEKETDLTEDLYFIAFAVRFIRLEKDIRRWVGCAKTDEEYYSMQQAWLQKYADILKSLYTEDMMLEMVSRRDELPEETRFWLEIADCLIPDPGSGTTETEKVLPEKPSAPAPAESTPDERLQAVASFMREGNRVLDLIGEEEGAADFMRCLLTSYQRLQNYCEIIGEKKICGECIDRVTELQQRLSRMPEETSAVSGKAGLGLRSLLGFTRPDTGDFDVFICHKSEDRDIAEEMYGFFRQNMMEPFFDKKTLPELAESEYHDAIMQALDRSAHFVVILSDLSYMNSKWVQLEMKTFRHEKVEGRKENGNFLLVVTGNVYDEIIASNKKVIPIDYRDYEILRVDEYRKRILNYIRRK